MLATEIESFGIAGYDPNCGGVDWESLLTAAARHMDSYLGKCTTVPLATPDENHKRINGQIAVWWALTINGFNPESDMHVAVRQNFEDAIAWLKMAAECEVDPGPGDESATAHAPYVMSEDLRGWGFGGDPEDTFSSG